MTKEGYFMIHPAEDVLSKTNASKKLKDFLEAEEYISLIQTPIANKEVRDAFILSCYKGLRWCDVKELYWDQIQEKKLVTTIVQKKTGRPVELTLHPISQKILDNRRIQFEMVNKNRRNPDLKHRVRIFNLPTPNGGNKSVGKWAYRRGIAKHITWHSARLSFSILLQVPRFLMRDSKRKLPAEDS